MNKYYTSIETIQEGQLFVGTVYHNTTNQEVYKSAPYPTHAQAVQDVNNFFKNQYPTPSPTEVTNTIQYSSQVPLNQISVPVQPAGRKCCGR